MRIEGLLGRLLLRQLRLVFFSLKAPFPRDIKSPQILKNLRASKVRKLPQIKREAPY